MHHIFTHLDSLCCFPLQSCVFWPTFLCFLLIRNRGTRRCPLQVSPARPPLTSPCDLFTSAVKRWEPTASLFFFFFCAHADILHVRCFGDRGAPGFTRAAAPYLCHALWFLFALVNKIMVIFLGVCRGCQRTPGPSASFYFSGGKVVTSPWWFSQGALGLAVLRLAQHDPAVARQRGG